MTVAELIACLQALPQDLKVEIPEAYWYGEVTRVDCYAGIAVVCSEDFG